MVCTPGHGGRKIDPNSIQQRALAAGLRPRNVHDRIARGWTLERALSTPSHGLSIQRSMSAQFAGILPDTLRHRMNRSGATLAQALNSRSTRWRKPRGRAL
jgi:hypothetical protein